LRKPHKVVITACDKTTPVSTLVEEEQEKSSELKQLMQKIPELKAVK